MKESSVGLVAFSMGWRANELEEPSLGNLDLARETIRIVREESKGGEAVLTVLQWEVANALKHIDSELIPNLVLWGPRAGRSIDSNELMTQAVEFFRDHGIRRVIPVAYPFLHLPYCRRLVRRAGFEVCRRRVEDIRLDPVSITPWTTSRWRILKYAIRRTITGRRGPYPTTPIPPGM